jgi:hypothetical protein
MRAKQFTQSTSSVVDEAKMNPSEFGKAISAGHAKGVLVGYEFEVCMPYNTINLDIGDGPQKQKQNIDHEWIADFFYREDYFGNLEVHDLKPAEFDRLFEFKPGLSKYKNMQQVYDEAARFKLDLVKEYFNDMAPRSRSVYSKRAMETLNSKPDAVFGLDTDNAELDREYRFAQIFARVLQQSSKFETSHLGNKIRSTLNFEFDDLFDKAFDGADSDEVDQNLNEYLDYEPQQVFDVLDFASFQDNDYDDNDEYYEQGASVMKTLVAHTFGTKVQVFSGYHESPKNMTDWYIEPDGSLEADDGDDTTMEIVSPPMPAQEAIAALPKFYGLAKRYGLYTNDSTGLHINVSIPGGTDVLKLAVFLGDKHILEKFGREDNGYARSIIDQMIGQLEGTSVPAVRKAGTKVGKTTVNTTKIDLDVLERVADGISARHTTSVSDNGKYISFRHAGGNYLSEQEDVKNVVGRFIRAMIIANDPTAYRQEYLKKLYQLTDKAGRHDADWSGQQVALKTIKDIRQNGVPTLTCYYYCPNGRVGAEPMGTKIAYDVGGRDNMWEVKRSTRAREILLSRIQTPRISELVRTAGDDMFYEVVVYPKMNSMIMFSNVGTDGIQTVQARASEDFGYYAVDKTRAPMTANSATKSLVTQLIQRYKTGR